MTEPQYETPTLTEIVDIIDLLRPWMHGFHWVGDVRAPDGVVCDCGWAFEPHTNQAHLSIEAYQRHVGYEE